MADRWLRGLLGKDRTGVAHLDDPNHRDAISAIEVAKTEAEMLLGRPLLEELTDELTGEVILSRFAQLGRCVT